MTGVPVHLSARSRRVLMGIVLPVVVGIAGAWLGLLAFARTTVPMGLFDVQLDAVPGHGQTDIALPPLGRVSADTHAAPLHLSATLTDVDVKQLQTLIGNEGLDGVAADLESEAVHRIWPFLLRALGVAMAGALLAALVAFRGHRDRVRVAILAALVAVGGSGSVAVATFDAGAFLQPTYSGTLALAPQLFGPLGSTVERVDYFREQLRAIVGGASSAYSAIDANPLGQGQEIRILHISDIHLSPLGFDFAQELARGFDVDAVLDTGDVTSFGTPAENVVASFIPGFSVPYVFVRGSHDSVDLQRAIERVPNATVVDGSTTTVAGVTIYGLGDPYFVEQRGAPQSDAAIEELVRSVGPRIAHDVAALPQPPAIVAVHDDRMAEDVAGVVPLVASGHFHENTARVLDGTLFLRVGTTGGAGPTGGFQADGPQIPLSAEILYFHPGTAGGPAQLIAWDVIEQDAGSGDLTVERHVLASEFGALTPSPAVPTTTTTPSGPAPSSAAPSSAAPSSP
jgi:predicted MPP superfamily phosphohydrolase